MKPSKKCSRCKTKLVWDDSGICNCCKWELKSKELNNQNKQSKGDNK
jgi:hypothetical protein